MLRKGGWFLLACIAIGIAQGCTTACDGPGRLCAPLIANTSAATMQAPPAAAPAPAPAPAPALVPPDPAAAPAPTVRVALLLPLRSDTLGAPSDAVRAGFLAAYEREKGGITVNVIPTGDTAQEALDAYAKAVAQNDIVVGPLTRAAVSAVATSPVQGKPTIALNNLEARPAGAEITVPERMLIMGLSMEDEARQVANWAATEHDKPMALVLATGSAWQQRIANAFAAHWKMLGLEVQIVDLGAATNGYLQETALVQLKARVEATPPALVFAALDAGQLRQVRGMLGAELPVYGTSSVNPGIGAGTATSELDGVRLVDLPWQIHVDHPAVMAYPRLQRNTSMDMDRLYALGIDAYRVAREIAGASGPEFTVDGVTGKLSIHFGNGPARFERQETGAVYQAGRFLPPFSSKK
jgi:outer membrane PBP1 activator LpoA protein